MYRGENGAEQFGVLPTQLDSRDGKAEGRRRRWDDHFPIKLLGVRLVPREEEEADVILLRDAPFQNGYRLLVQCVFCRKQ